MDFLRDVILDFNEFKDIKDADVVMLYLADEMNIRLRPMLWKALKPGARIVSHRFTMGDWKPNKTIEVKGEDGDEYTLHLWIITTDDHKRPAGSLLAHEGEEIDTARFDHAWKRGQPLQQLLVPLCQSRHDRRIGQLQSVGSHSHLRYE